MIHINDHLTSMNFSRCCLMLQYFFCVLVCVILFEFLVSTCHYLLKLPQTLKWTRLQHWTSDRTFVANGVIEAVVFLEPRLMVVNLTVGCTCLALYLSNIGHTSWATFSMRQVLTDYVAWLIWDVFVGHLYRRDEDRYADLTRQL